MNNYGVIPGSHTPRYALSQRLLHWSVALLVLASLATGLTIGWLGFEGLSERFGMDVTNLLYKYHKTLGVLILGLMLVRLVIRLVLGKPAYATPLSAFQRIVSQLVHVALYLFLLVQPVLGWLATAAGDYPVQFFEANLPGLISVNKALSETLFAWHEIIAWLLIGLISLHIAGALYHWLIRRDGVMRRMGFF